MLFARKKYYEIKYSVHLCKSWDKDVVFTRSEKVNAVIITNETNFEKKTLQLILVGNFTPDNDQIGKFRKENNQRGQKI